MAGHTRLRFCQTHGRVFHVGCIASNTDTFPCISRDGVSEDAYQTVLAEIIKSRRTLGETELTKDLPEVVFVLQTCEENIGDYGVQFSIGGLAFWLHLVHLLNRALLPVRCSCWGVFLSSGSRRAKCCGETARLSACGEPRGPPDLILRSGRISGSHGGVWGAPGAREGPPPFWMLLKPPGAAQTPKSDPKSPGQTAFKYPA